MLAAAVLLALCAGSASASLPRGKFELFEYQPMANPAAVVKSGNARFTVLTDRLIRMEYSASGNFEDRASMAFLNRNTTVPKFSSGTSNGVLTINTTAVSLAYTSGPFSAKSLKVQSLAAFSTGFSSWQYGEHDSGNLLGTIKSLDVLGNITLNCTENADVVVHGEQLHCTWGLISRSGFSIVNDTHNQALSAGNEWWDGWTTDDEDLYGFFHGHDYRGALADFTKVAGKIAMIPRYGLGNYFTRWYDFGSEGVEELVDGYTSRDVPLDVLILDMNWHLKPFWGAYTFDSRLLPYPEDLFSMLRAKGLAGVGVNLHDDDGVRTVEAEFAAMAKALNMPTNATIPFSIGMDGKDYMYALQDIVLKAVGDTGVSFWWTDWQQGGKQGGCTGGAFNPTIMLAKMRGTEFIRRGEPTRAINVARWGGLGGHRYQVGFSGDVATLTWTNLAYQPYFSSTGSNVGYGFWSHDIEGPGDDHEMYVRWVQWGSFSSIMRSHDRGMSAGGCDTFAADLCSNVRVWEVPTKYFEANRAALRAREALIPYLYTATRQAFDTGLGLTRPMYYDFPKDDLAYASDAAGNFVQYMLGDDIMVAPITAPADNTSMTPKTIFTPVGTWYEETSGMLYTVTSSSSTLTKSFALSEVPQFVRGGAVIPRRPLELEDSMLGLAQRQYANLEFSVYPGASAGSGMVYEDDGATTAYVDGAFAYTKLAYTRTATTFHATVSTSGTFPEMPAARTYVLRIVSSVPPTSVTANGKALPYGRAGGANTWTYDGPTLTTVIRVDAVAVTSTLQVDVTTGAYNDVDGLMSGLRGALNHALLAKQNFDETRVTPGAHDSMHAALMDAARTGYLLTYLAGKNVDAFMATVASFKNVTLPAAVAEVDALEPPPGALMQLFDSSRQDHVLCASAGCDMDNSYYSTVRIEGYGVDSSHADAIPLNDFWNADAADNWVTTATGTPSGYSTADFSNGFILSTAGPGTAPLQLWYSSARKDHVAVATAAGIADAKANGYTLVNATLGYVNTAPSVASASLPVLGAVQKDRWAYSVALLKNTYV